MQIDLVRIRDIASVPVGGGLTRHTVNAEQIHPPRLMVQYVTVNDCRASICQIAKDDDRHVWIGWEKNRYGKTIKTVQKFAIVARNPRTGDAA